jgi:hypothetical protein
MLPVKMVDKNLNILGYAIKKKVLQNKKGEQLTSQP